MATEAPGKPAGDKAQESAKPGKDAKLDKDAKAQKGAKADKGGKPEKGGKAEKEGKAPAKSKAAKSADAVAGADDAGAPNIAAHPRAKRAIARAKGWGGLLGFLLAGYLSLPTSTLAAAGLRALVAGVVCYVVVWAGAVFVWRRLVMIELKAREQRALEG